jgi:hypothetical protein
MTTVLYKVDFSGSGGLVYDNISTGASNPFDDTGYLNVPLPPNLNGFTISVKFFVDNVPHDFSQNPLPTPPNLTFTNSILGDVIQGNNVNPYDNCVIDFIVQRSAAVPMPMTYTFSDTNGIFTNVPSLNISYGNVTISTTTPSVTYGSVGTVKLTLYNSVDTSTLWTPSNLITSNIPAQIGVNYIPIFDDESNSSPWGYNPSAGDTYSNSIITYNVSDRRGTTVNTPVLNYTPFARFNIGLMLRYPNAGGSASISYTRSGSGSTGSTGGTGNTVVPCFFGDALVLTLDGYKRIDSLKTGDEIITNAGVKPIEDLNKYTVEASPYTNPYLIPKGKFGALDHLLISPEHCIKIGNSMIAAKQLGLEQQSFTGPLTYYNIRLKEWNNMFVEGVEVETMAPVTYKYISIAEFENALLAENIELTPETMTRINQKYKFLDNGMVECPIFAKRS